MSLSLLAHLWRKRNPQRNTWEIEVRMASRKEKDEEPEQFKVVDRRPFTSEGDRRADAPPEPEPPAPAPPPSPSREAPTAKAAAPPASSPSQTPPTKTAPAPPGPAGADERGAASLGTPVGPIQFEHLIMSLVSSAMYQLGMAARPGEPPPPADFPAAQETIDLLAVLEKKTQGNLTPEESQLLLGGLQELRLAFVELSRRAGRIR